MKRRLLKILERVNKAVLLNLTKRGVNLAEASKLQLMTFGWRLCVTMLTTG